MLCDSHCHISKNDYKNIDEVIQNALNNKVGKLINNATNRQTIDEVLELCNLYENMYAAIGIHPQEIKNSVWDDLNYLEKKLKAPKVVAIGEIGLDYHYTDDNKQEQIKVFEHQLLLAEKYNLPVIVHNRQATDDVLSSLKKFKVHGVIHCFSGSLETAKEFIKLGFYLGINGVITFKNCKTKDVLKMISVDNLILETDCPYLTPEPFRGTQNEPKYIKNIADFISQIYGIDSSQVEKITNRNIKNIFDI